MLLLVLLTPLLTLLPALIRLLLEFIPNDCLRHLRSPPLLAGVTRRSSIRVGDARREATGLGGIVGGP